MTDTDTVDGTAAEVGTDLEHVEHTPTTLFRTDDPVEVVERASRVADALKGVLDKQGLTANISGKRHVLVEGWTTLGAMVGVTAIPVWTKPLDGEAAAGKTFGFEARVEVRTLDGRVIGAAEAMCTRAEGRWKTADDYAIRSMAQTRATSKALRGPLGFVVTLAGYSATPAEEMGDTAAEDAGPTPLTQDLFDAFRRAFVDSDCKNEVLLAKMDELGVAPTDAPDDAPSHEALNKRVDKLTGDQARALTAWLREAQS